MKAVYDLVKDVYPGDVAIPMNKRNTKEPEKLPTGNPYDNAPMERYFNFIMTPPIICCLAESFRHQERIAGV